MERGSGCGLREGEGGEGERLEVEQRRCAGEEQSHGGLVVSVRAQSQGERRSWTPLIAALRARAVYKASHMGRPIRRNRCSLNRSALHTILLVQKKYIHTECLNKI
jgi:hypothetical protein